MFNRKHRHASGGLKKDRQTHRLRQAANRVYGPGDFLIEGLENRTLLSGTNTVPVPFSFNFLGGTGPLGTTLTGFYTAPPSGATTLGGEPFNITSQAFESSPAGAKASGQMVVSVNDPTSVEVLVNSVGALAANAGATIGNVTLNFGDGTSLVTNLVLGQNIREWTQGNDNGATVNTVSDANSTNVFSGPAATGTGPGVIDMLTIPLAAPYNTKLLTNVAVNDTTAGTPAVSVLWSGLSIDTNTAPGTLNVTPTLDKNAIVKSLLSAGTGVTVTSSTLSANTNVSGKTAVDSSGVYSNPGGIFGIGDGIILSSGDVSQYGYPTPPPTTANASTAFKTTATPAQYKLLSQVTSAADFNDVTELSLNFNMPATLGTVFFNVVFASVEFPEHIGAFLDGFGLFVNGKNIAQVNNQPVNIDHPDMAYNSVNALSGILAPNGNPLLQFSTFVGAGSKNNTLTFIIADSLDHVLDSTAYISALGALPPDKNIPTAVVNAPKITGSAASETFTVTYTGTSPIDLTSIGNSNIVVTGPAGYSQAATLLSTDSTTSVSPLTATYMVSGPGGAFSAAATYDINMQFQQVKDIAGHFVTEGTIGQFKVNGGVFLGTGPVASISASPTFLPGSSGYFFDVTYTDDPNPIQLNSLDNRDILVTGPNGFSQLAHRVGVNADSNQLSVTATYEITPPGTTPATRVWAPADAGNYTFNLQSKQVLDVRRLPAPATALGTMALTPFGGLAVTPVGEYGDVADTAIAKDATGRPAAVAFYDPVTKSLKYLLVSRKTRLSSPAEVDNSSANVGLDPALVLKNGIPYMAYYDAINQNLKLAYFAKGKWKTLVLDSVGSGAPNPSIALDSQGRVIVSYYDSATTSLKTALLVGTAVTLSTVDATGNTGAFNSMALDPLSKQLDIAYADTTNGQLKFAKQQSDGTFSLTAIPGTTGADGHVSFTFDNAGQPDIAFQHAGTSSADPSLLEFARLVSGTWTSGTVVSDASNVFTASQLLIDSVSGKAQIVYRFQPMGATSPTAGTLAVATGDLGSWTTSNLYTDAGDTFSVDRRRDNKLIILSTVAGANEELVLTYPAAATVSTSADFNAVGVEKKVTYVQGSSTAATTPSVDLSGDPGTYGFAAGFATAAPQVSSAVVIPPSTTALMLNPANSFQAQSWSTSQAGLDALDPNGSYSLLVNTNDAGAKTFGLSLTGDAYPSAPDITNFTALQTADSSKAMTISWAPFTGATGADIVQVRIFSTGSGSAAIFNTPLVGSGALAGTATSVTIPAGTLSPGQTYIGEVTFLKVTSSDTTTYPGAVAQAAYAASTEFYINPIAGNNAIAGTWSFVPDSVFPSPVNSILLNVSNGVISGNYIVNNTVVGTITGTENGSNFAIFYSNLAGNFTVTYVGTLSANGNTLTGNYKNSDGIVDPTAMFNRVP